MSDFFTPMASFLLPTLLPTPSPSPPGCQLLFFLLSSAWPSLPLAAGMRGGSPSGSARGTPKLRPVISSAIC